MDKSSDVRKSAEACIAEILSLCGHEAAEKSLTDIQGPALALVLERLKPFGSSQAISTIPTSKSISKVGKSAPSGIIKPGMKAVSSRNNAMKGSRQGPVLSVQDIAVQSHALINVKDSVKLDRERIVVKRFKFEEPRLEQIQDLENDMMKYFREDLHRRLLSTYFKKQVDGLEMLQMALPTMRKEMVEVLDIMLRWFVVQFCKSNTTSLLKVLEFLHGLFDMFRDEGYMINESEAVILLPCLMEKLGHNGSGIRKEMKELARQIVEAYTA